MGKKIKNMDKNLLQEKLGDLIHQCTYENFKMGYDPMSDIITDEEYKCDLDPVTQAEVDLEYDIWLYEYRASEYWSEYEKWEKRCKLREITAPEFYDKYFKPFFDTTLKNVYDNKLTEELKFYKPSFDEWIFMILVVMTEYYFRERYPCNHPRTDRGTIDFERINQYIIDFQLMDVFTLHLDRNSSDYHIKNRYNALSW
jgi:hypothetical protein